MDYFSHDRRRGNSVTQDRLNAPLPPVAQTPGADGPPQVQPRAVPGRRGLAGAGSFESLRAPSSIRIRRLPSGNAVPRPGTQPSDQAGGVTEQDFATGGRRRSTSEPQRYGANLAPPETDLARQRTQQEMPTITEGVQSSRPQPSEDSMSFHEAPDRPYTPGPASTNASEAGEPASRIMTSASAMADAGNAARANRGLRRFRTTASSAPRNEQVAADEYESDVVDLLDLVGTCSTISHSSHISLRNISRS